MTLGVVFCGVIMKLFPICADSGSFLFSPVEVIRANGTGHYLPDCDLDTLQEYCGGYVAMVETLDGREMYVNEDGVVEYLSLNVIASRLYGDTIVGDVVVVNRMAMN